MAKPPPGLRSIWKANLSCGFSSGASGPGIPTLEAGSDVFLDLSLQFLARGGLERRDCGIGGVRDESPFGLGLDAICEMRD